jgi:hypothetical protein
MLSRRFLPIVPLALFLIGSSALNFSAVAQGKPSGRSGVYDSLLIGVDEKSGLVTGYFEESTGWDEQTKSPRFTCAFFLYGKLQGDVYQITTWYPGLPHVPNVPDKIKGRLKFVTVNGLQKAHVKLEEEPGGCGMAHPFMPDGGDFELSTPGAWSSVRLVSARRAYFHQAPDARTKEKTFVVRNNAVRVYKVQNGWAEAEFGGDKIFRGWLKESDLFAMSPR